MMSPSPRLGRDRPTPEGTAVIDFDLGFAIVL